jgi:hypothetical protein
MIIKSSIRGHNYGTYLSNCTDKELRKAGKNKKGSTGFSALLEFIFTILGDIIFNSAAI